MICYNCKNIINCNAFRVLNALSSDFDIKQCKNYQSAHEFKYKRIAENDKLMKLIYAYFTNQIDGYSEEEAKAAITRAMLEL